VFFFWPAWESLRLSFFRTSAFGDRVTFVGLDNFTKLLGEPDYYQSVINSFVFAFGVTGIGVGAGLLVAALATQKIRGLAAYRTAVLWPYGIAAPIAGIIFLFMFHPSYGVLPYWLSFVSSYEFNWLLKGWVAMALVIVATAWTHVGYNIAFFLAGLLAIPESVLEAASVDGAPLRADRVPAPRAHHLLPGRREPDLLVLRLVRDDPRRHAGRPRRGDRDHGVQGLQGRVHRAEHGLLGGPVGDADARGDRAHRAPVPVRRAEDHVLSGGGR
jgi:hypothetical protein